MRIGMLRFMLIYASKVSKAWHLCPWSRRKKPSLYQRNTIWSWTPYKYVFGVTSGKFLRFMIISRVLRQIQKKLSNSKYEDTQDYRDMQSLNGKLIVMNPFLAKSIMKSSYFSKLSVKRPRTFDYWHLANTRYWWLWKLRRHSIIWRSIYSLPRCWLI